MHTPNRVGLCQHAGWHGWPHADILSQGWLVAVPRWNRRRYSDQTSLRWNRNRGGMWRESTSRGADGRWRVAAVQRVGWH